MPSRRFSARESDAAAATTASRASLSSGQPTPRYVRMNVTIILLISLTLLIAATGTLHERAGPAFLTALTAFLTFALVAWLRALSILLVPEAH